jgi:cAMP-specific phosphodiesterase 4
MALFVFELVTLSVVDAQYCLSFFQLMDVIGTISMIFDISYMLGADAKNPETGTSSAEENALGGGELLRAARAAKVGARAGRLSRVLRILRFLPFLSAAGESSAGIASLISSQLVNLLASRVACLTIILVMFIPLFDIWTFPQNDYSLQTWLQRLSNEAAAGEMNKVVMELRMMTDFYSRYSYGPYIACIGHAYGGEFVCDPADHRLDAWVPKLGTPPRMASAKWVFTDTFMIGFNFHAPRQLESGLAMLTIFFIVFIMVFSGLALSSVVMQLAVRPLERMLDTVRQIATTVFNLSAQSNEDATEQDELVDIDSSNEMKLLEKVVQKLAIIADLQTTKTLPTTQEASTDEDIGIFNMMHGKDVVLEAKRGEKVRQSIASSSLGGGARGDASKKQSFLTMRLEDFGVPKDVQNSAGFNALPMSKAQRIALGVFTISRFHDVGEVFSHTAEDEKLLHRFVTAVDKEYMPVPFHSFAHAIDVVHGTARIMRMMCAEVFLAEIESYSLLVAAVSHDLGHPGVNNGFLSEVGHELALQYNDRSPLENMHCAKLYTLVANPMTNIFEKLTKEQYKEVRKYCIDTILHTDMMRHQAMVNKLNMTYQVNTEIFLKNTGSVLTDLRNNAAEIELFSQGDTKMLIMENILHSADVSNPCRVWEVSHAWAMKCLEEFFAQGDEEKRLGIPVQFLNDRDKLNKPNSQIGFIEFMIAPFFVAQIRLWPSLRDYGHNLSTNLRKWEEMWVTETAPAEEEKLKIKARVDKVQAAVTDASTRGGTLAAA